MKGDFVSKGKTTSCKKPNISSYLEYFVFLLVGVLPLLILMFKDIEYQLKGSIILTACIWAAIFKLMIVKADQHITAAVKAIYFSATAGAGYVIYISGYLNSLDLSDVSESFLYIFLFIGLPEELCKFLPVLFFFFNRRDNLALKTVILVAVFSAIGFSATENVYYATDTAYEASDSIISNMVENSEAIHELKVKFLDKNDEEITEEDKKLLEHHRPALQKMVKDFKEQTTDVSLLVLFRAVTATFGHAAYSGLAASIALLGISRKRLRLHHAVLGILLAAAFHSAYNWSISAFASESSYLTLFPTFIDALCFTIFFCLFQYLQKEEIHAKQNALQQEE